MLLAISHYAVACKHVPCGKLVASKNYNHTDLVRWNHWYCFCFAFGSMPTDVMDRTNESLKSIIQIHQHDGSSHMWNATTMLITYSSARVTSKVAMAEMYLKLFRDLNEDGQRLQRSLRSFKITGGVPHSSASVQTYAAQRNRWLRRRPWSSCRSTKLTLCVSLQQSPVH